MYSHLRLVVDPHYPWIVVNQAIDKQYCKGIQCELLKYVSKSLNFTYEYILDKHGDGDQLRNKTWIGSVGTIFNNVGLILDILSLPYFLFSLS